MTEQTGTVYVTAANTSDTPVVVDQAGRMIEAHGFGTVDPAKAPARTLLEAGTLVESYRPEGVKDEDLNPDAVLAYAATAARNEGVSAAEVAAEVTAGELAGQNMNGDAEQLAAQADETPTTPARTRRARS